MSMLAGPKRKQKWTLNPRGKEWSEDSNKFGQKMLEKMGWTSGKGLGAKEQGMVEHIRVKVKNDQVGIGFDKNRDDHWTEHQDVFNSFLQNLQKEQTGAPVEIPQEVEKVLSGKSLEERSKLSQKRVHYKKFTRGKDVNKYSTKDLANIFGKKDLNEKTIEEEKEEDDEKIYDPVGTQDHTAGILTIKGGSMNDYFKKKFSHVEYDNTTVKNENSESETEQRVGFGFSAKSKSTFYVNDDNTVEKKNLNDCENDKYMNFGFVKNNESKSKNKKHNNLNYVFDNPCLDLNILDNDSPVQRKIKTETEDLEYNEKVTPRKRKSEFTYDNIGLDLDCPDRPTTKKIKIEPILNSYENPALDLDCSDRSMSKTNKKIKVELVDNGYENLALDLDYSDRSVSKKNKKIKVEPVDNGYENPALGFDCPDRSTSKKNKKIKIEPVDNGYENLALDLDYSDRSVSKKNKKIKIEPVDNGYENPALGFDCSDRSTSKKNKKIKDEPVDNEYENSALDLDCSERSTSKKKKKIKVEPVDNGYENSALDVEYLDRPTPKKNKKTKGQFVENGYENPALNVEYLDRSTPKNNEITKLMISGIENPALDLECSDKPTPKRSKKVKIHEVVNGIENSGLDLEYPDKPTPKKIKILKVELVENGIQNFGLDLKFPDRSLPKNSKKVDFEMIKDGIGKVERSNCDLEILDRAKKSKKGRGVEILSTVFENSALDLDHHSNNVLSTSNFEVSRATCGLENNALDLSDENSSKKRVTFNDQVEYNTDIYKKKKKKRKLDKYEVVNEKVKKKSNPDLEPVTFINEGLNLEIINEEEIDNEINERKSKKGKRRRERRMSQLETIEEAPEEENLNEASKDAEDFVKCSSKHVEIVDEFCSEDIQEIAKSHKKKNKRKKDMNKIQETIDIVDKNINENDICKSSNEVNVKNKKKSGTKTIIEEIEVANEVDDNGKENVEISEERNPGIKKEKKKKRSDGDIISLKEFLNEGCTEEEKTKIVKQETELVTNTVENTTAIVEDNNLSSFQKFKKSKQVMKSLFLKNPTLLFNGSNINEIKGYGSNVQNNY